MLLLTAATGAWAQSGTTHVVDQSTVESIFSGEGYTLGDAVSAGDELVIIDEINITHSLVINKPVTIRGEDVDAVVKLNTQAGTVTGNAPGNSFIINKDGAGTTVKDIRLENTQTWIYNTSNVTFTGVTMWVKNAQVGSGVGHVSIRWSNNVTFDGCTIYTEDNSSSSACVLIGSKNCTIKNSHFESAGFTSSPLYLGNIYNDTDKPSDFGDDLTSTDDKVLNCTFKYTGNSSVNLTVGGLRHRIEGCTLENVNVSSSFGLTLPASADEGHIYSNNTIMGGGFTVLPYSTAENNTVNYPSNTALNVSKGTTVRNNNVMGNVTISYNSSDYVGSTVTGNNIVGKLTIQNNSKNNSITDNTIISTEEYAVVMPSTKDANNTVQNNVLMAVGRAGDEAVNTNGGTGNTISGNLSQATAGGVTWSYNPAVNTLTIGGTGAMANYEQTTDGHSTAPWAIFDDMIECIVIGADVTAIGDNAFYGCTGVTIVFAKGDAVPTLGSNAFDANATFYIYVSLYKSVFYQEAWPAYTSRISEYMSCGTDAMAVLYYDDPMTLTIYGNGAMTDYSSASEQPWRVVQPNIEKVVVKSTITSIGAYAFANCSYLRAAYIEGTATTITDCAFDGNHDDRKIFVPITAVGNYTASNYAADIYATGYCGATGSEESVSWQYSDHTKSLAISGTGAMADNSSHSNVPWFSVREQIESATIAQGVTSIGQYVFCQCFKLENFSIPSSVTTIGERAFQNCSRLETIDIPASVSSVGKYAFAYCSSLAKVTIFAPSLTTYGIYAFRSNASGRKIYVPASFLTTYKTGWSAYAADIESIIYNLQLKDGTVDAAKWTITSGEKVGTGDVTMGVNEGNPVTLQYTGRRKVKSVTATHDGPNN